MARTDPRLPAILGERVLWKGAKFDFAELTLRHGGREYQRQFVRHPGAVCVLPVLGKGPSREIVLIRNHRPAVDAVLWEIPAGTLEPAEAPETCAARELVEETGYRAATLRPLGRFHTSPGLSDEVMWAFLAERLEGVGQRLEADEHIEVRPVLPSEALRLLESGEMTDAKSMLTLLIALRRGLIGERDVHV